MSKVKDFKQPVECVGSTSSAGHLVWAVCGLCDGSEHDAISRYGARESQSIISCFRVFAVCLSVTDFRSCFVILFVSDSCCGFWFCVALSAFVVASVEFIIDCSITLSREIKLHRFCCASSS